MGMNGSKTCAESLALQLKSLTIRKNRTAGTCGRPCADDHCFQLQGKRANKAKKMIKELMEDDKDNKNHANSK